MGLGAGNGPGGWPRAWGLACEALGVGIKLWGVACEALGVGTGPGGGHGPGGWPGTWVWPVAKGELEALGVAVLGWCGAPKGLV